MTTLLTQKSVANRLVGAVGWEAKNRLLVQLAREVPRLNEADRSEENRVAGCESRAWLEISWQDEHLVLLADSDSRVVQGLLALVFACYYGLSAQAVLMLDFEAWITELGLMRFLTTSRGNGLRAIVLRIREAATLHMG